PQGRLLTFNLNTANDGQGIVHAVELTSATPTSLAGERYRLEGNGFGMIHTDAVIDPDTEAETPAKDENFLFHVDGAELSFSEDGRNATLLMNQVQVSQDINSQEVSRFKEVPTGTCTI